jgi:hypothetical protein
MRTKCLKQLECCSRKGDHCYVPCLEIKLHPKNAWQSFENLLVDAKNDIFNHFELSAF